MKTARAARRRLVGKSSRQPESAIPFKAFIAYADVTAARQAMNTINEVLQAAGRPHVLVPMLWRFEQLRGGRLREAALADSMHADVVVFASSNPGSMPAFVEQWVGEFLALKRGTRVNAVALLGEREAWTISIEPTVAVRQPSPAAAFPVPVASVGSRAA